MRSGGNKGSMKQRHLKMLESVTLETIILDNNEQRGNFSRNGHGDNLQNKIVSLLEYFHADKNGNF